jgi:hypothetical protein
MRDPDRDAVEVKTKEGTQGQTNVVALATGTAKLTAFDADYRCRVQDEKRLGLLTEAFSLSSNF